MIPSTISLGCLLSYCPTCPWRKLYCPFWKKNIFRFGKCICGTSHVCCYIHYHKQIYGTFENNFSNTNVKNVANTILSSLTKIQQSISIVKTRKIRPQTN